MPRCGVSNRNRAVRGLAPSLLALLVAGASEAVVLGQIDDFQSGGTQGWEVGFNHPSPPQIVPSGGPGGSGDAYLRAVALGGFAAGSRLAVFNESQWSGDYASESISAIWLDAIVLAGSDVSLRIGLTGAGGSFASALPLVVQGGTGWQALEFSLEAADLIALSPAPNLAATLASASELRLLHADTDIALGPIGPRGEPIATTVGFDNIEAVPEPHRLGLLAGGLAGLLLAHRRRCGRSALATSASESQRPIAGPGVFASAG